MDVTKEKVLKVIDELFKLTRRVGYTSLSDDILVENFKDQVYKIKWLYHLYCHSKSEGRERELVGIVLEYLEPILFCAELERDGSVEEIDSISAIYNKYKKIRNDLSAIK